MRHLRNLFVRRCYPLQELLSLLTVQEILSCPELSVKDLSNLMPRNGYVNVEDNRRIRPLEFWASTKIWPLSRMNCTRK